MIERWKDIEGYNGHYKISNFGRVKSFKGSRVIILKPNKDNYQNGYLFVGLSLHGVRTHIKIHRLVALHFVKNLKNKPFVNHKNTNKCDNYFKNLEWVTAKENVVHAWKNNMHYPKNGEINGRSILTEKQVLAIRQIGYSGILQKNIAIKYNIHRSTVNNILKYHTWKHLK